MPFSGVDVLSLLLSYCSKVLRMASIINGAYYYYISNRPACCQLLRLQIVLRRDGGFVALHAQKGPHTALAGWARAHRPSN